MDEGISFDSPVTVTVHFEGGNEFVYEDVTAAVRNKAYLYLSSGKTKMNIVELGRILSMQLEAEEEGVLDWDDIFD